MQINLYKVDAKGVIRHWQCEVDYIDERLFILHGVLNGEYQERTVEVEENQSGRDIDEQLELEANSRAKVKRDSGYKDSIEEAKKFKGTGASNKPLPMLAQKINFDKIDYSSCFVQRKYDGHRCIIYKVDGIIGAYSRKGLEINSIDHILQSLDGILPEGTFLDGELYIHGLPLQTITSLVKRPQEKSKDIKFICYDIITDEPYSERFRRVDYLEVDWDNLKSDYPFELAPTYEVSNKDEISKLFMDFRSQGYEGAIVRHGSAGYNAGKRSKHLMKVKACLDEEFYVIDIVPSVDNWARLVCATKDINFTVTCHGTHEYKAQVYQEKNKYIGRFVKVEFSHWTNEGKPFHPVAICWKEDKEL